MNTRRPPFRLPLRFLVAPAVAGLTLAAAPAVPTAEAQIGPATAERADANEPRFGMFRDPAGYEGVGRRDSVDFNGELLSAGNGELVLSSFKGVNGTEMLEEAVAEMKGESVDDGSWSPQINAGTTVMIPDSYVADLQLRLQLYRRLADLTEPQEIDAFGAELVDRFGGPLPEEVQHLLKIVFIKALCRRANVVQFRGGAFADPAALVGFIGKQGKAAKIRPDQSVVFIRDWPTPDKRLAGSASVMMQLAKMAEGEVKAAA